VFSDRVCEELGRLKLISAAIAPVRTARSPNFDARTLALLAVALAIAPTSALAEVQVRGSSEAVKIEARDTSVEEVLEALSHAFEMDYQSSVDLDKRLYGTYVGPLSRVVTRILQGYNFVLKTDNGSIVVTVVGTPQASAVSAAPPALPASADLPAPAPQPRQSAAPAPAPWPGSPKDISAPALAPKPPSAPRRAL
jgi:hypothetical protein